VAVAPEGAEQGFAIDQIARTKRKVLDGETPIIEIFERES